MFLAVLDGHVMERSSDIDTLIPLEDQGYEVFEWDGPIPVWKPEDNEERPLDRRRVGFASCKLTHGANLGRESLCRPIGAAGQFSGR